MENQDPGQSRSITTLKRTRASYLSEMTPLYKQLESQMITSENVDSVKKLYAALCQCFEVFREAHLECLDVCENVDACDTLEKNYESAKTNFDEFQERYSQWLLSAVEKNTPDDDDKGSVISSLSTSTVSSRSKLHSAKAKRLIAEQKHKVLNEKVKLERAKKEIELQQQLLETQSAVDTARLEESVWQAAVEELEEVQIVRTENIKYTNSREMDRHRPSVTDNPGTGIRERVHAGRGVQGAASEVTVTSIDQAFQRLASALHEGFNLPKPDILRFDGSPLDYCKFVCNFEATIEQRVTEDRLRLGYLIQYCGGEAKMAIEDCVLLESHEGYKRARDILYSRYGRPYLIARTHIDNLVNGPTLKASDTNGLSKFALELRKCEITLSQIGFKSDVNSSDNLRRLVKRLPMHVRGKWVEIAHSVIESGREPSFSDFVKFVEERTRVATSMYGLDFANDFKYRNDIVTNVNRQHTVQNDQNYRANTLVTNSKNSESDEETYVSNGARVNDARVDGNSVHIPVCLCCSGTCTDLASCKMFKAMSLSDREEFVRTSKLCFNCLKGRHFAIACRRDKGCAVLDCKSKHHYLLHKWVSNTENAVVHPSVNCAATIGSVRNCLGIIPVTIVGGNNTSCQTYALLDDGADKTLCDGRLLQNLDLPSRPVTFNISTATSAGSTISGQEVDLIVQPLRETMQLI